MARNGVRDNQRQRVYDSEGLAFEGTAERDTPFKSVPEYKTVAECQQFVDEVLASPAWKHLCPFGPDYVTVADGRGRRRAGAYGSEKVAIPKFARRRWVLLHELAHIATSAGDWAGHGPEYVSAYLYLVSEFLSPQQHAALVSALAAHRVKVCDYMGGGVYDGTTVRYVTATDTPSDTDSVKDDDTLRCAECGMGLSTAGMHHTFCSDRCRWTYHNRRRRQRTAARREKVCEVCGNEFVAKRADTKTCSNACKQKAYRQRTSA